MKIFCEIVECAAHGQWREPTHCAERTVCHYFAEVDQHINIGTAVYACGDFVDEFYAAGAANAAWCAFAAAFNRTELHSEAGLGGHVHCVVKHHDAAVTDNGVCCCEGLVVERQIKTGCGDVGT